MKNYFFKARTEWADTIMEMSDEDAGIFAKAIWAWASGGEPVTDIPENMQMFYRMAIRQLVEDLKDQRAKSAILAENGRKGAEKTNGKRRQMLAANAGGKYWRQNAANSADIEKDIDISSPLPPLSAKSLSDLLNEGDSPF